MTRDIENRGRETALAAFLVGVPLLFDLGAGVLLSRREWVGALVFAVAGLGLTTFSGRLFSLWRSEVHKFVYQRIIPKLSDLHGRLANRVQLTTDGHNAYLDAVDRIFGIDVDFAQLVKIYASVPSAGRYSPPICVGAEKIPQWGDPDHISTSYVERNNLTMRMQIGRFTRLTNAFSRKVENHAYAVDIHMMHYNFCRPHMTLTESHPLHYPTTPAMAAGIADHVWTLEEVCALMDPSRPLAAPPKWRGEATRPLSPTVRSE